MNCLFKVKRKSDKKIYNVYGVDDRHGDTYFLIYFQTSFVWRNINLFDEYEINEDKIKKVE